MRSLSYLLAAACLVSTMVACSGGDSGSSSPGSGGSGGSGGKGGKSGAGGSAGTAGKNAGGSSSGAGGATAGKGGAAGAGAAGAPAGAAGAAGSTTAGNGGASAGGAAGGGGGGAGGTTGGSGGSAAGSGGSGQGGASAQGGGGSGPVDHGPVKSLSIEPSLAQLDIIDGAIPAAQVFKAIPTYQDGFQGDPLSNVSWAIDQADLATLSAAGEATATGLRAGDAIVTASALGLSATAELRVAMQLHIGVGSIAPDAKVLLDSPGGPDPSAQLSYPYDQTVFPRGLLPPELMWSGSVANEPMKLTAISDYVTIESYFVSAGDGRFAMPEDAWSKLTEGGKGGSASIRLARVNNGAGTLVGQQTWKLASGNLRGTVYYWANTLGRVVRIKPGASQPDDFLAAAGINGCTTCHAVSANGSTMIIGGDEDVSTYDLINNTKTFSTTSVGKALRNWAMPAISPSGKFLIENNEQGIPGPPGGSDGMWDTASGTKLNGTGLDGVFLNMPAFSPEGSRIAYVDHNTKALSVMDYTEAGGVPQASNPKELVPFSGDPANAAFVFPSMSPDGKWITYARSNLDTRFGPGDMFLTSAESPSGEIALDAVNGTTYPFAAGDRDRHFNYEPTFMPVAAGGYYWVVFTSRRTYGNRLTAGKDNVKQLWVAAIDIDPKPGQDPSHPAFWVPGQDLNTLNMRGFWALDPCREDGQSCSSASQCCGKVCLPDGTCGGGQEASCKQSGETCGTAADCCFADQGYQCINSHCTEPKP